MSYASSYSGNEKQFVYLVEGTSSEGRLIKIGHSWNVVVRLGQLRRSMGLSEIRVIKQKRYNYYSAIEKEKTIHRRLREYAVGPRSEWYWFNESVISVWNEVCK